MAIIVKGGGGKPEEEKTVTAGTSVIEVNPSSGKVMKKVTVNPTPTESKSVTPTTSELTVTPSEGKHLSQVVVGAVEDVTPEVTAQTPVITQIAENLGVTITTPSGTNKQILQGNNANLLNIKNNAKKEGTYVWKKYPLVDTTVSNPTITLNGIATNPTLSSQDINLDLADESTFGGFLSTSNPTGYYFKYENAKLYYVDPDGQYEATYDQTTHKLSIPTCPSTGSHNNAAFKYTGNKVVKILGEPEFVVSDSESAYPDGGYKNGYWYELYGASMKIVTWANGTDEEIVAMVEAADQGLIKLSDYWSVGDTRTVQLSAMSNTGVGESQSAQGVDLVLMHAGGYKLKTAVASGRTECSFVVGQKDSLATKGYMNSSNTNSGSWDGSARRVWCNNVYKKALPSTLLPIFKQFKTITAQKYNGATNQTSVDYFALPAAKEVFGGSASSAGSSTGHSNLKEFNELFQFDYYKTASNRVKKLGKTGSASDWWERSPYYNNDTCSCCVNNGGGANYYGASATLGLAPFGCI